MSSQDFTLGQKRFKISKLDAMKQFHIVRRMAPVLGELIPAAAKLKGKNGEMSDKDFEAFGPVITAFSKLSDEDANRVLMGLCSCVEIYQDVSKSWARVATDAGLMFNDLELPELLNIAGRAFVFNMKGFFSMLPQVSHGGQ